MSPEAALEQRSRTADAARALRAVEQNVAKVIRGKPLAIRLALTTLIARGHLLETANPQDGRSRLITLSPALKALLEQNFDLTAQQLRQALEGPGDPTP